MKIDPRVSVLLILSFITGLTNVVAELESVDDWSETSVVTLPSDNGPVSANVRTVELAWRRRTQTIEAHTVKTVVVPSIGFYWLGYSNLLGPENDRRFFVLDGRIIGVATYVNGRLCFYPSANRLSTPDPKKELDSVFHRRLDRFESEHFDVKAITVVLDKVLGVFPFIGIENLNAQGEPPPKITNIEVAKGIFTIGFVGGKDDAVSASITFDTNFKPLKGVLKGKQVFPAEGGL
jgi:hypothetical protein